MRKKTGKNYLLQFDGATVGGNPGRSGIGFVIYKGSKEIFGGSAFIGDKKTNNEAEYSACIEGLKKCHELGIDHIKVQGDSMLVVQQTKGEWAVKAVHLREYVSAVKFWAKKFKTFSITWIPREENTRADELSGQHFTSGEVEAWNNQIKRWKSYAKSH